MKITKTYYADIVEEASYELDQKFVDELNTYLAKCWCGTDSPRVYTLEEIEKIFDGDEELCNERLATWESPEDYDLAEDFVREFLDDWMNDLERKYVDYEVVDERISMW